MWKYQAIFIALLALALALVPAEGAVTKNMMRLHTQMDRVLKVWGDQGDPQARRAMQGKKSKKKAETRKSKKKSKEGTASTQEGFRLVTYNDVYQISAEEHSDVYLGGAALTAAYVKKVRQENENTLVLMAGDTISPSLMSQFYKGSQMIEAHNKIGLNFSCLGNHEFDFGLDILEARLTESHFTWLNGNVYLADGTTVLPNTVYNTVVQLGDTRVGMFGLLGDFPFVTTGLIFKDVIESAKEQMTDLRSQGVDFVIAMTHSDAPLDCEMLEVLDDAGLAPDLLVGGHDHIMMAGRDCGDRTPWVKSSQDFKNLWDIHVTFAEVESEGETRSVPNIELKNVQIMDTWLTPDQELTDFVQAYEDEIDALVDQEIGVFTNPLDVTDTRTKENGFTNFLLDFIRLDWAPDRRQNLDSIDAAFINGGAIRTNEIYPAGPVSVRLIKSILPFENYILLANVSGAELKQTIGELVNIGQFLQVSGVQYSYERNFEDELRFVNVEWFDTQTNRMGEIADEDMLIIATNDFIMDITPTLRQLPQDRVLLTAAQSLLVSDICIAGVERNTPVTTVVEGRIVQRSL